MKYIWNIFILHAIGIFIAVSIGYPAMLIMEESLNRELAGVLWIVISLIGFVGGICSAHEEEVLLKDWFSKLTKLKITMEK